MYVIEAWDFTSLKELKYPDKSIRVNIGQKVVIIIYVQSVIIGVFRRIKLFIIILHKLVDLNEVVSIKIVTLLVHFVCAAGCHCFDLYAKVSFDRFGKELCLISVSLGSFHVMSKSQVITLALWFKEVFDFMPRLSMVSFQANVIAELFSTSV